MYRGSDEWQWVVDQRGLRWERLAAFFVVIQFRRTAHDRTHFCVR